MSAITAGFPSQLNPMGLNMRPQTFGTRPMFPGASPLPGLNAPRSLSPQQFPPRSYSPSSYIPGGAPLINNQLSRNLMPSQPYPGGYSPLGMPPISQPLAGRSRLLPSAPIMSGASRLNNYGRSLSPGFGGSGVRIRSPSAGAIGGLGAVGLPQPLIPPGFGGSGVRVGQPLIGPAFGGSGVRVGQPIVGPSLGAVGGIPRPLSPLVSGTAVGIGAVGAVGAIPGQQTSRIQYVPYQKKIIDYQPQQVYQSMWVPVQKKCLNYYGIEHITQYIPRQVDDFRYELVPQEQYYYRLQYVPVQRDIVHFPNQGYDVQGYYPQGFTQGIMNPYSSYPLPYDVQRRSPAEYVPGYKPIQSKFRTAPRTNYVTSDGYVPSYLRPQNALPSYLPFGLNPNVGYLDGPGNPGYSNLGRATSLDQSIGDALKELARPGGRIQRTIGEDIKRVAEKNTLERGLSDGIKDILRRDSMNSQGGFY